MPKRPWQFDPATGRFRSPSGRFLSARDVRNAVDRRLDDASAAIARISDDYRAGRIAGSAWMAGMRDAIRETHLMSALAAKGGRSGLTQRDYGVIGQRIRRQYRYLSDFAQSVNAGSLVTDGRFMARAQSYGQAGRGTFDTFDREEKRQLGYDQERNVLDREAAHCTGFNSCPGETARGWVPIGVLLPIGERKCTVNDRCRIVYRNSRTGQVTA